jgi:hypothetical protein
LTTNTIDDGHWFSDESEGIVICMYFLSVRMKQSDWLRSLSERVGFLHPAVKRNCPL